MIPPRWRGRRSRLGDQELTSLDERLGLLLIVRIGMTMMVLLAATFATSQVRFTFVEVGPLSATYLVVAAAAEWYRRSQRRGRMTLHRAILPLDAVYLAIVTTPSGGPRSQLVVLFAVQLIAVTLLVSERAGIRIALWDSFLFIVIPTLSLSGSVASVLGVRTVPVPPASQVALGILGFWLVALSTAFFASVSERELRRSKAELEALARMAAEMEDTHDEEEILAILLRTVVEAFPFQRGALWWSRGERPQGLAKSAGGPVRPMSVSRAASPDHVAVSAWAGRTPVLVRRLDPLDDPVAARLLPAARNVVVLPLQIDGGESGITVLEHGRDPLRARLPRRTLLMLGQFGAHAALSLRNARLLAARERDAAIDGLTGVANRREFDLVLAREVSRTERSHDPLSLVVFDVDHFKKVNDTRGHLAGDQVLRSIGVALALAAREMDLVARYGGEEFALILPRCDQHGAEEVVRRVRRVMSDVEDLDGITLSSGVASLPANASSGLDLVAAADEAMYESKRAGRDRCTLSDRVGNSHAHFCN